MFGKRSGTDPHYSPATSGLPEWLLRLGLADPHRIGNLVLVPLVNGPVPGEPYLTQHVATQRGVLELLEQGAGSVPHVEACNHGGAPILILEGDILIGAKQNRVVSRSVLIPAGKRLSIPVGCIERGRWDQTSAPFVAGDFSAESSLRYATVMETNAALVGGDAPRLNQARLWSQIDRKLHLSEVDSSSSSYYAILKKHGPSARRASIEYVVGENQLGVVALWYDTLLGLELVGHPETWKEVAQRLIPSLVLAAEAAEQDAASRPATHARPAGEWLAAIAAARIDARPAIGLGDDVALTGAGAVGSCLWHEGRPAHLVAFAS